jgi:alkylated DNA repair dioxygenase AlkB
MQVCTDAGTTLTFNQCLVNWYEASHYIAAHSDDERQLVDGAPIFSLSWGMCRRFKLTSRDKSKSSSVKSLCIDLDDGDLLVMGGTCQKTHKHEVPPIPKKEQAISGSRINFTCRCFK